MRGDLDEGFYPGEGQGAAGWCLLLALMMALALFAWGIL